MHNFYVFRSKFIHLAHQSRVRRFHRENYAKLFFFPFSSHSRREKFHSCRDFRVPGSNLSCTVRFPFVFQLHDYLKSYGRPGRRTHQSRRSFGEKLASRPTRCFKFTLACYFLYRVYLAVCRKRCAIY